MLTTKAEYWHIGTWISGIEQVRDNLRVLSVAIDGGLVRIILSISCVLLQLVHGDLLLDGLLRSKSTSAGPCLYR